ncbi:MAG: methyltransferase [Rubrivivax sp.]|nr:methyltransferase [Rubrivivax sp.]
MSSASFLGGWMDRWQARRDRWLTSPGFREAASRFIGTRPLARRHARELFDLVAGFVYSQWLAACVELKLFDRLAQSPITAPQLSRESGLPLPSAERLLEAACSLELVQRREAADSGEPRFGLGRLGALMVGNEALTALVQHHGALYRDLADPLAVLRSRGGGELARYWAYAQDGAPGELPAPRTGAYSALMSASQPLVAGQVLDAYPLHRHRLLLDIGGGEGVFAGAALERTPDLQAMVFDLPSVADAARLRLARLGLSQRARCIGGNFHDDRLPAGADVVSLIRVLYDHDDGPALGILRAARRALPPGGTLLVAEPMAGTASAQTMGAAYFGMYLLAMGSGRSRTPAQLTALMQQAGFDQVQQRRTAVPLQAGLLVARAA